MSFFKKHLLLTLFILGLLIRVALMFLTFSFDVNNHISWAQDAFNRGFSGFYETQSKEVYGSFFPVYPPLAIFSFYIFYLLFQLIVKVSWWFNINIPLFPSQIIFFINKREFVAGLLKIPGIIGDLGIAYVSYLFAKKLFPKKPFPPLLAASLILFNPAFIYNSSLWGQIDSLAIFFLVASFYLLINRGKYLLSGVIFVLATLVKPTVFISLPLYGLFFIKRFGLLKTIISVLIGSFVFWLIFLPFYKTGNIVYYPYISYYQMIVSGQGQSSLSISALNFWSIFPGLIKLKDSTLFLGILSYRLLGYSIILVLGGLIIFQASSLLYATFLINFMVFLFSTRMHERYIIFALPFLLITVLKNNDKVKLFVLLSLLAFFNLFYSWAAFNNKFLTTIITHLYVVSLLSFLNLLIFIYFLKQFNLKLDK